MINNNSSIEIVILRYIVKKKIILLYETYIRKPNYIDSYTNFYFLYSSNYPNL